MVEMTYSLARVEEGLIDGENVGEMIVVERGSSPDWRWWKKISGGRDRERGEGKGEGRKKEGRGKRRVVVGGRCRHWPAAWQL